MSGSAAALRVAAGVVGAAAAVVLWPSVAHADSARPTDYRSEVVEVVPATTTIDVSIVGGDSFVMLRVEPGVEVIVLGYESEPYLQFASPWMRAPSRWPVVLGALGGALLLAAALAVPRGRRLGPTLAVAGGVAAVVGWIGYASLPAVTGPRVVWWLLPVLAVAFAVAGWVLGPTPGGFAAWAIAALELASWALDRRAGLSKAILPTDTPFWLDRAVTAGALTVGAVAAVMALAGLFGAVRGAPARR